MEIFLQENVRDHDENQSSEKSLFACVEGSLSRSSLRLTHRLRMESESLLFAVTSSFSRYQLVEV